MRYALAVCLTLLSVTHTSAFAGKLSRTRDAVRSPAPSTPSPPADDDHKDEERGKLTRVRSESRKPRPRRDDHVRDHHYYGGAPVAHCGAWGPFWDNCRPRRRPVCAAPICTAPVYVLERPAPAAVEYESSSVGWLNRPFAAFPYADPRGGGLLAGEGTGKPWSGRLQIEGGGAGDGIDRSGVSFLIEESHGFGLDFEWDSFNEDLPSGATDELHLGELNLMYRVVETEHALVRAGVGVAWLGDAYDTDTGVNFTLQADLLPCKPWVLSAEADFGTLGDAERLDLSATAGVALGRFELYGGYDYHRIGNVELQGPTAGVRLWW